MRLLAWQEYLRALAWPQSAYSREADVEWSCAAVGRRYVDDAMFISKLFCYDCLSCMLKDMYSVTFHVVARSRQLQWLDLIFDLDTCKVCVKRSAFQNFPLFGIPGSKTSKLSCGEGWLATSNLV